MYLTYSHGTQIFVSYYQNLFFATKQWLVNADSKYFRFWTSLHSAVKVFVGVACM